MVFGEEAARGRLLEQLRGLMGPYGAEAIQAMLAGAKDPQAGIMASAMSLMASDHPDHAAV
jgi:membrane protein